MREQVYQVPVSKLLAPLNVRMNRVMSVTVMKEHRVLM